MRWDNRWRFMVLIFAVLIIIASFVTSQRKVEERENMESRIAELEKDNGQMLDALRRKDSLLTDYYVKLTRCEGNELEVD